MRRALLPLFAFVMALFAAPPADALLCVPLLGCSCTVTASDLDFEEFDPFSGPQEAVGNVIVDCTGVIDVAPTVSTRIGAGQWGTVPSRKMRSTTGELLDYNIYTTDQHAQVWGDGTGGSTAITVSGGLLTVGHWQVSRDMHGLVTPTVTTKPGAYSDTVVVQIVW